MSVYLYHFYIQILPWQQKDALSLGSFPICGSCSRVIGLRDHEAWISIDDDSRSAIYWALQIIKGFPPVFQLVLPTASRSGVGNSITSIICQGNCGSEAAPAATPATGRGRALSLDVRVVAVSTLSSQLLGVVLTFQSWSRSRVQGQKSSSQKRRLTLPRSSGV